MINYKEEFIKFWNSNIKYSDLENKKNKYKSFMNLFDKYDYLSDIDDYIISRRAFNMKNILLDFYEYYNNKYPNNKIETILDSYNLNVTPIERQLYILKNTHGYFKIQELADIFNCHYSTIDDDIKKIQDGISFMDVNIKPNVIPEGAQRKYEDTVHPFFLALNKTEAYALTKELPEYLNNLKTNSNLNDQKKINMILGLITKLQVQLSDKAKEDFNIDIDDTNKNLDFISEKDLVKGEEGEVMFWAKRGCVPSHIILDDSTEYFGTIEMGEHGKIFINDKLGRHDVTDKHINFIDYK